MNDPAVSDFAAQLAATTGDRPYEVAVVLGSGLGGMAEGSPPLGVFPYATHPVFPRKAQVAGHAGRLIAVEREGRRLLFFQGRFHGYQGLDPFQTTVPVRIAHALGCRRILLTSAVGAINPAFSPGDAILISDHLNFSGLNPLAGLPEIRFVSLNHLYTRSFFPRLQQSASRDGLRLQSGILAYLAGPSYETPAEIRALSRLGADVVGMSLVPEAIMARALGMEVAGLSLVSNAAAGLAPVPPSHEEVLAVTARAQEPFTRLCWELIEAWCDGEKETG